MIPNEKKRKLTLGCSRRKLYPLLRGINKLTSHKKARKNKDFCGNKMPSEKDNILEFNQYINSDKMSYIIYATLNL